jgi:hypothetical protein
MIERTYNLDRKVIDWLLEGPAWLKYAVELQLLDTRPDISPVLNDPVIQEIVGRLKDQRRGIPAIVSGNLNSDEYENPYWDLFFLADLGLTAADLGLNREIDGFLDSQSHKGTFITEFGMEPTYYCKSAILLRNSSSFSSPRCVWMAAGIAIQIMTPGQVFSTNPHAPRTT